MKLSIITTFSNNRQEAWKEALDNYCELADEVVVVYDKGDSYVQGYLSTLPKVKAVALDWPFEYDWSEFPRHFNQALALATGDWVIKLDIDLFIHEDNFKELRSRLEECKSRVASLHKVSVYGDHYYSKGNVVNCLRREVKDNERILQFGGVIGEGNDDLVGIVEVEYVEGKHVPMGRVPTDVYRTGVNFWNFDYSFKSKEIAHRDFARMARAYKRYFKKDIFGKDDEDAIRIYEAQRVDRTRRAINKLEPSMLPKHIRDKYYEHINSR